MSEVGVGKSYKPFSVMLRKEDAYKFESSANARAGTYDEDSASNAIATRTTLQSRSIEAISGPIEEPPSLTSKNNKGQVKKHNVISENYKVLKLAEESEFSYTYSVENYKGLYHTMGGVIDYPYKLTLDSASAFGATDTVYLLDDAVSHSGTNDTHIIGVAYAKNSNTLTLRQPQQGESLGTGTLLMIKGDEVFFDPTAGYPSATAPYTVLTGATSGAKMEVRMEKQVILTFATADIGKQYVIGESLGSKAVVTHVSATELTVSILDGQTVATGDTLTGGVSGVANSTSFASKEVVSAQIYSITPSSSNVEGSNSVVNADADDARDSFVTSIVSRHTIFGHRTPPHYSLAMHYESIDNQYLMTGAVCNEFGFEVVSNDVPKGNQTWQVALVDLDATKDTEPTNSDTTLYEYTDIVEFLVNGVDYADIFKSLSLTVTRDVQRFFGANKTAKGMIQPEIKFNLSCGLLREDRALVDLRLGNTDFTGKITLRRGTAGEDEAILHFTSTAVTDNSVTMITPSAGLRLLETPESEDEGKIFHELTFDVTGLPVFEIVDGTQYYG